MTSAALNLFEPAGRFVFTDQRPFGLSCIAALDLDTLRVVVIDPLELRVLAWCAGKHDGGELARVSGDLGVNAIRRALARLSRLGLLRRRQPSSRVGVGFSAGAPPRLRRPPSDRPETDTSGTPFVSDRAWRERTPGPADQASEAVSSPRGSPAELLRFIDVAAGTILVTTEADSEKEVDR